MPAVGPAGTVDAAVVDERLRGMQLMLDQRLQTICTTQAEDRQTVKTLRTDHDNLELRMEQRMIKLERIAWLFGGAAAFLSPVAVWAIIQIFDMLTGLGR